MRYVEVRELWLAAIQGREVPRVKVEQLTRECMQVWEAIPNLDRSADLFAVKDLLEDGDDTLEELSDEVSELRKELEEVKKKLAATSTLS
jgi:archaellum component FlaC